jgi:hypothetical protein
MFLAMRALLAIVCTVCLAGPCSAKDFVKQAKSGEATEMWTYASWHSKDCSPNTGIVKLVRKPAHGTLKTSQVDVKITYPRNPEKNVHCIGKPVPGFRVEYTSEPNFHGSDSFQIHVTFGKRTDIDNFSIKIE